MTPPPGRERGHDEPAGLDDPHQRRRPQHRRARRRCGPAARPASRSRRRRPSRTTPARPPPARPRRPARRRRGRPRSWAAWATAPRAASGRRRVPQGGRELGVPAGQQVEQHPRAHHEHAGVPAVGAGREVARGHLDRRLLHERPGRVHPRLPGQLVAEVDVAERRGRRASGAMPSVTSQPSRRAPTATRTDSGRPGVGDHVVGGEGADDGVGVLPLEQGGGEADRGHRVARRRLGEHGARAERGQLLGDRARCGRPVTTRNRSSASGASRAQVSCSSDMPLPVRSWRNFGDPGRDSGQRRVPGAARRDHRPEVVDGPVGCHGRSIGDDA